MLKSEEQITLAITDSVANLVSRNFEAIVNAYTQAEKPEVSFGLNIKVAKDNDGYRITSKFGVNLRHKDEIDFMVENPDQLSLPLDAKKPEVLEFSAQVEEGEDEDEKCPF